MKRLLPRVRVLAILRHPIDRARSRFAEQVHFRSAYVAAQARDGWGDARGAGKAVFSATFDAFAATSMAAIRRCKPMERPETLARAAVLLQCAYASSMAYSVLGFSLYHDQVSAWLAAHGDALLVLYLDDLAADPAGTMALIEAHVGLDAFSGYGVKLGEAFNTRASYGFGSTASDAEGEATGGDEYGDEEDAEDAVWLGGGQRQARRRPTRRKPFEDVPGKAPPRVRRGHHRRGGLRGEGAAALAAPPPPPPLPLMTAATRAALVAFFRPTVAGLAELAAAGRIRRVPPAWLEEWEVAASRDP